MSTLIATGVLALLGILAAYVYAGTRGAIIAIAVCFTAACLIAAIQFWAMGR